MLASLLTLFADAPAVPATPAGGAAPGGFGSGYEMIFIIGAGMLLLWFVVLRPAQKQEREKREQLSHLKPRDEVITAGGIIGTVVSIKEKAGGVAGNEDVITLRVDEKVKMQVLRSMIVKIQKGDDTKKEGESTT